jgi:Mg2+-importing ATPase
MTVKDRNTTTTADARLSMRAAREARNGLAVTLANLDASELGLTEHEAAKRLQRDGANEVAHDNRNRPWCNCSRRCTTFIYVLLTLAAISFVTDYWLPLRAGDLDDLDLTKVIIILTMVSVSGLLRFWQEYRSSKAAEALKAMVAPPPRCCAASARHPRATARSAHERTGGRRYRAIGRWRHDPCRHPPDRVARPVHQPGRAHRRSAAGGKVRHPRPCRTKSAADSATDEGSLLDLPNIGFMGTNVVSGRARAVVVATGSAPTSARWPGRLPARAARPPSTAA